jgi:hypothetical protein
MKNFKNKITEGIIYKQGNYRVIDSNHGPAQKKKRRKSGDITLSDREYEKMFSLAIDKFEKEKSKKGDYLIYSRTMQHGIIVNYHPGVTGKSRITIITYLPKYKQFPKPDTMKILVEDYHKEFARPILDYVDSLLSEGGDYLTEEDKLFDYDKRGAKSVPAKYEFVFVNGELYDTVNFSIIDVF